jgi:hypothetical protein
MAKKITEAVGISAPNIQVAEFKIRGTSPFVQLRFSQKAKKKLHDTHEGGDVGKTRKKEPKNFEGLYEEAMYFSTEGWRGVNAMSFRRAMIAACRLTKMDMKRAKMAIFIEADGYDAEEGIPLVKFIKGEPHYCEHICRNANKQPDLRVRAMWDAGWEAALRIKFDADIFGLSDVANLLMRAGLQVGIGEGRADSTSSDGAGMGWGEFEIVSD